MSGDLTPAPSRVGVNATMLARGLRSAAELAADKPCGTRVRYYAGCRCDACRGANSAYERSRIEARARGEHNHLVSAERARAHLAWLSRQGVGRKQAADSAKVAASVVNKIIDGGRQRIRAQTERRILAVTPAAAADRALIDGTATWQLLDELLAWGYSKTRVATEVAGRPERSLQIKRGRVTARTAEQVRRAHARLRLATRAETRLALLQLEALYEEGYRRRILQLLAPLALARGWPTPTLTPHKPDRLHKGDCAGLLLWRDVVLVDELHRTLVLGEEVAS